MVLCVAGGYGVGATGESGLSRPAARAFAAIPVAGGFAGAAGLRVYLEEEGEEGEEGGFGEHHVENLAEGSKEVW